MKRKVVEVSWLDPTIHPGWVDKEHEEPLPVFKSYGVLLSSTRKEVKIAHGIGPKDTKCDVSRFPKGCILEIKTIAVIE